MCFYLSLSLSLSVCVCVCDFISLSLSVCVCVPQSLSARPRTPHKPRGHTQGLVRATKGFDRKRCAWALEQVSGWQHTSLPSSSSTPKCSITGETRTQGTRAVGTQGHQHASNSCRACILENAWRNQTVVYCRTEICRKSRMRTDCGMVGMVGIDPVARVRRMPRIRAHAARVCEKKRA